MGLWGILFDGTASRGKFPKRVGMWKYRSDYESAK